MSNTHEKYWPSAPRERAIEPTTDWRDTATACFEWLGSGFIGLLLGSFIHCYAEVAVWLSAGIAIVITFAMHSFFKRVAKKYN